MKRSKDYYQHRKMLKELSHTTCKFKPKKKDIIKWFDILNEQIFGKKLSIFGKIKITKLENYHALFHYFSRKDNEPTELEMNKTFKNEKLFVEILAHEMIHLFQYQYNEPLGHGPSFWVWSDIFTLKGLKLHKVA